MPPRGRRRSAGPAPGAAPLARVPACNPRRVDVLNGMSAHYGVHMEELMRVLSMQALVRQLEDAADAARLMRDSAIFDYVQDPSVNRRELCRQLGISSARLYGILSGEADRRDFAEADGQLVELRENRTRALWDSAFVEWLASGEQGSPEDYFDFNELHVRL